MGLKKNQIQAALNHKVKSTVVSLSPVGAGNMEVLAATPVGKIRRFYIGNNGQYTNVFNGDDIPHLVQWQIDTTPISQIQSIAVGSDLNPRSCILLAGEALNVNIGEAQNSAPLTATVYYTEEDVVDVSYGRTLVALSAVGPTTLVPTAPVGKIRVPRMDGQTIFGDPVLYNSDLSNQRILTLRVGTDIFDTVTLNAGAAAAPSAVPALSAGQSLNVLVDDVPVDPLYVHISWDDFNAAP